MQPKARAKMDYEKVKTDDWTVGVIEDIQFEANRNTGFKNTDGTDKLVDSVRFKFKLEGYQYPHYSNWMAFSYNEKSGLLTKYLFNLVEEAKAEMEFDLDALKGMPVKVMWMNKGDFQKVEMIRPVKEKIGSGLPF